MSHRLCAKQFRPFADARPNLLRKALIHEGFRRTLRLQQALERRRYTGHRRLSRQPRRAQTELSGGAALEIEKEREARKEADRRADAAERKLERAQGTAATQREADIAELRQAAGELAGAQTQLTATPDELMRERTKTIELQKALDTARDAAARSAQDAATVRELLKVASKATPGRAGRSTKRARVAKN